MFFSSLREMNDDTMDCESMAASSSGIRHAPGLPSRLQAPARSCRIPLSTGINANEIFESLLGCAPCGFGIHGRFMMVLYHNFVIV